MERPDVSIEQQRLELDRVRYEQEHTNEREKLAVEREKVLIEREKLAVEKDNLKNERSKKYWTAAAAVIPIVVALGTIMYGVYSLKTTAQTQFQTKLAELALAGQDPDQAKNRAAMLAYLFHEYVPDDFQNRLAQLQPEKYGTLPGAGDPNTDSKKHLFDLLALHPEHRSELLHTWKVLFPGDKWISDLEDNPPPARRAR